MEVFHLTDQEIFNLYIEIIPFLAEVCGSDSEIVIHDGTNPENSIIAIENSLSGRKIGDPMTDLAIEFQEKKTYTNQPYVSNYSGKTKDNEFLSFTYFIKNKDKLIGFLCINKDMRSVKQLNGAVRNLLARFNLETPTDENYKENLDTPVVSMINNRISEIIAQSSVTPSRMTRMEKISIVHRLDEEGLLSVKGAIGEIAEQLSVSIPTVYRYLNKTNL